MSKKLLVGLGNPGPDYENTRHNAGFMVIDAIAQRARVEVKREREEMLFGWGKWRGRELGLAKPQTYMNRSGTALEVFLRRYKVDVEDVLVIADDINLPMGTVRMRPRGGAGGHNGIQDVIDWLDTQEFARLRLGVGNDFEAGGQSDYVLAPFSEEQREPAEAMIKAAMNASLAFATDGVNLAMNRFNSK